MKPNTPKSAKIWLFGILGVVIFRILDTICTDFRVLDVYRLLQFRILE